MSWVLLDEDGLERKVNSVTTLDGSGAIVAVRAIFNREIPLVDTLWQRNEGDTFTVDFAGFNSEHGYAQREIYNDMRKHERLAGLGKQTGWIFAALAVAGLLWLGWSFYDSMSTLKQQSINSHNVP